VIVAVGGAFEDDVAAEAYRPLFDVPPPSRAAFL
jgi:hypothetical protein